MLALISADGGHFNGKEVQGVSIPRRESGCGRKEAGQVEDETAPRKGKVFNKEEATGRRTGPQTQNDSLSKHPQPVVCGV